MNRYLLMHRYVRMCAYMNIEQTCTFYSFPCTVNKSLAKTRPLTLHARREKGRSGLSRDQAGSGRDQKGPEGFRKDSKRPRSTGEVQEGKRSKRGDRGGEKEEKGEEQIKEIRRSEKGTEEEAKVTKAGVKKGERRRRRVNIRKEK